MALLVIAFFILSTYSYFLYPALLWCLCRRRPLLDLPAKPAGEPPRVSLIITAHNEEHRIEAKLDECLACDYPSNRLEILVASDASTDATDSIVGRYADQGIRLARAEVRQGKEYAQSVAIKAASGEILVFSDVGTTLKADAIQAIVAPFDDPGVGAVSSEDTFLTADGAVAGEGLYVRYEMWLRQMESRVYGLVGLSGSFFAARSHICQDWDIAVPSDFNTALNCAAAGLRAVSSPFARGYYQDVKDPSAEFGRKLRTVLRGMAALSRRREVLNPRRFGGFAWQVWSHKLARWATPWFLAALLVVSLFTAADNAIAALLLAGQLIFYGLALAGYLSIGARNNALVRLSFFFTQVNLAIMQATIRFLRGHRVTVWDPTKR